MPYKPKAYLTWALDNEGNLVHVDKVPNGNKCGCVCPNCKENLCAKNGGDEEKRIHHFAHISGADCAGAIESAIHKMAKDILLESKCIKLPKRFDGNNGEVLYFDKVEVEFSDAETNLRPDCIGYYEEKLLWIEFKKTHAVDEKKRGKIISANVDCVEIDLNNCELDPQKLKEFITSSSEHRIWIRDTSQNAHALKDFMWRGQDNKCSILKLKFAKDETGKLVYFDDTINMNQHTYYCLSCGKELTIDIDNSGTYSFVHIENDINCDHNLYLHEAAKEIIYDKFNSSKKFEISVPQIQYCEKQSSCQFHNEDVCLKEKNITYDLKDLGYTECEKDTSFISTNNNLSCDLIIKRNGTLDNAIIICIDDTDYINEENILYRTIQIRIENENSLEKLRNLPIGGYDTNYIKFNGRSKKTIPCSEINRTIQKFSLFPSGKYYHYPDLFYCGEHGIEGEPISKIFERKYGAIYEIIFISEIEDVSNVREFFLYKCYKHKIKACYCELCLCRGYLNKYYYDENPELICKRYKTKGTPQFPLTTKPINCPHFILDKNLFSNWDKMQGRIKVIERIFFNNK